MSTAASRQQRVELGEVGDRLGAGGERRWVAERYAADEAHADILRRVEVVDRIPDEEDLVEVVASSEDTARRVGLGERRAEDLDEAVGEPATVDEPAHLVMRRRGRDEQLLPAGPAPHELLRAGDERARRHALEDE